MLLSLIPFKWQFLKRSVLIRGNWRVRADLNLILG